MPILDIHTHIFPDAVCSQREKYFAGEPAFELLYRSPRSRLIGAGQLVAAMDDRQIHQSVTFGFPWRSSETARRHNDCVLEAVARYPDRLIGFGCLDPLSANAAQEAERCLAEGMAGIGELAFYESDIDDRCLEALEPIMILCRQYDRPVMIHANEPVGHAYPGKAPNTLVRLYALLRRFPENRIILAHWGGGLFFYALARKEVPQALANIWFDTAASPYLYRPAVYHIALTILGAEKILFGTDYPLLPPERYFQEMDDAGLTAQEKMRICHDNAATLLKLDRTAA